MGLIIGLADTALSEAEKGYLRQNKVAGVILFTRNFQSREQIVSLINSIRGIRKNLLICVDQEGGRVQRFREGFAALPALAKIGARYAKSPGKARTACKLHARIMALDMLSIGIDLSFAPVADLQRGNLAIGDRAFSANPEINAELVALYSATMQTEGMAATLKHFPGHGTVKEDTHTDLAADARAPMQIFNEDLLPFATAMLAGAKAVMTAHVSYPKVDAEIAGYSKRWLKQLLRADLGFEGAIISDDVGMAGGANVGPLSERIARHYQAGCDFILVCSAEATQAAMADNLGRRPKRKMVQLLRAKRAGRARRRVLGQKFSDQIQRLNELTTGEFV